MTPSQERELRRGIAEVMGPLSLAASIGKSITPEQAKELADRLEAARVRAGWEPLKLYHQKELTK